MADRTYYRKSCQVLDYTFDWTDNLLEYSDTISSYTLTTTGDLVIEQDSITDNVITYWISGTSGSVTCDITTAGAREDCRTSEFIEIT